MRGKITKLSESANPTHPKHIPEGQVFEGEYFQEPTVGQRFCIGDIATSTVFELLPENKFRTHNSIYQLTPEAQSEHSRP